MNGIKSCGCADVLHVNELARTLALFVAAQNKKPRKRRGNVWLSNSQPWL